MPNLAEIQIQNDRLKVLSLALKKSMKMSDQKAYVDLDGENKLMTSTEIQEEIEKAEKAIRAAH